MEPSFQLRAGITPSTRVVAMTWMHSCSGVKLPIHAMGEMVAELNTTRAGADHILFLVDGVQGFGIEDIDVPSIGCDVFVAGTHRWLFDHRWSLPEALRLHLELGKATVQQRIHELNTLTKEGLLEVSVVTLHTPLSQELSSGMVCFDYQDLEPGDVVEGLYARGIISSTTPYRGSYARFAPSLINNEEEIERSLAALASLQDVEAAAIGHSGHSPLRGTVRPGWGRMKPGAFRSGPPPPARAGTGIESPRRSPTARES